MSSAGRAASSSGCVARPRGRETGLTGYAEQIQRSLPTGSSAMETAEHREPYESRGSRTDLGAPGGESPPGDSTLVFGARRSGLAGVIALAPNGAPERLVGLLPQISESVARARAMVAEGRGDERASFTDLNIRGPFSIETTPAIYLSFFDPAGPANMLDNTLSQGRGSCDGSGRLRSYVRPLWRGRMTAGPDGLRGSGPKKKSDV